MPRGKHAHAGAFLIRRIELHLHQLIHILQHQHIAVQLDHAIIFCQAEGRQLRPAVVEARVIGVVLADFRQQILDALRWDAARAQSGMPGFWEGVGVEGDERVGGVLLFERVVEGEEPGEILGVSYEGGPDCWVLVE